MQPAPQTIGGTTVTSPVALLVVARASDQTVLARRADKAVSAEELAALEAGVARVLESAGKAHVYPGWKSSLVVEGGAQLLSSGSVHAAADALCIVVVAVRGRYPERLSQSLVQELVQKVRATQTDEQICEAKAGQFTSSLKSALRETMQTYSDPAKMDKVTEVHQKVDEVKGLMQDNVRKILETHVSLEALQSRSETMSASANQFLKQSSGLKRQVELRNMKVKLVTAACISALAVYACMELAQ